MCFQCAFCWYATRLSSPLSRHTVCWLVGCLTSLQHASVSQGRICSDHFTFCHTEIEAADQTFYLTQSQYTDTGPTSPSTDPIMPGACQGSHWSASFQVAGMTRPCAWRHDASEQSILGKRVWLHTSQLVACFSRQLIFSIHKQAEFFCWRGHSR